MFIAVSPLSLEAENKDELAFVDEDHLVGNGDRLCPRIGVSATL